jgi:hypothetical protein
MYSTIYVIDLHTFLAVFMTTALRRWFGHPYKCTPDSNSRSKSRLAVNRREGEFVRRRKWLLFTMANFGEPITVVGLDAQRDFGIPWNCVKFARSRIGAQYTGPHFVFARAGSCRAEPAPKTAYDTIDILVGKAIFPATDIAMLGYFGPGQRPYQ